MRDPETRLPSETAPSIPPKSGASSALSEAPEDRHTYLFLFEDKVRVIWTGVGTATGRAACRAQYEMPLGTSEHVKLLSSRGGLAHRARGRGSAGPPLSGLPRPPFCSFCPGCKGVGCAHGEGGREGSCLWASAEMARFGNEVQGDRER